MSGWRVSITAAIAGALLTVAVLAGQTTTARPAPVDFTTQIRPLLSDRCFRCHGPDAGKRKAELRLDVPAGALKTLDNGWSVVKPGNPERSELIRRVFADDDDVMPPSESRLSLTDGEKALLLRWVEEGADYRPHWAFLPVRSEPLPRRPADSTSTNPIDAFIATRLADAGLRPAPAASRETFIRRAALTLTGLPPTVAEIDAFLADTSPQAFEHAVDRYLASAAYGERMAMDWLDLARYADTYGYQADVDRDMSPYRDWVIRAFNDNLPYDQFLTWQLAGDLLPRATRDQRIATAFNRLHRQTNEGGSIEEEFRTEYAADRVNTFGTAMLGLTLECARCHDHKFDPITQRDYFSLFAFFNNIDESGLYSHFTNATPTPALPLWPAGRIEPRDRIAARIAETERHLQVLARSARGPFERWIGRAQLRTPAPVAHLAFDVVDGETTSDGVTIETTPDRVLAQRVQAGGAAVAARLQDGPQLVREPSPSTNGALRFSGDNSVVHPGAPTFVRTDPFSLSIRLMPTEEQPRAVVVHQSRAWTDAGSRGFELTLDRGRPFFALIHFWPGNAIAVRATRALPLNEWSRLTVTYDGSSRAAGIRLYLDGAPLATDVVRDRLVKDISYRPEAGDRSADTHPLTLAARFRDSGFKNGLIDDLQVFNVELTAVEAAALSSEAPPHLTGAKEEEFEYFLAREHQPYVDTVKALRRLREQGNALVADVPEIMVMEDMHPPRQTRLLKRGAYDAPGEVVERDTPASLPPFPANQPRNRLGLARWLTSPQHPLAARVVVNRIWRMHFGRGIVATPEDFGSQGKLPTHPALLDWLTDRFMKEGWDVKALHRRIVLSATFRQSSVVTAAAAARDPENQLLSRWPKTRLLAEQIRDSALAASGLLNRTVGGPSVKPYQPAGLWEQSGTGKTYRQDTGLKLYRRSLYTFWRRTAPPPAMTAFDAVTREVCVARREATVTPLQSLVLLNDPQFVEASRALAERVLKRHPEHAGDRHREAFRSLIGRLPDETEAGILAQMFQEQHQWFARHPADALKYVRVGDSAPDSSLPPADLAALTAVVNAIVNFDEFVVLR